MAKKVDVIQEMEKAGDITVTAQDIAAQQFQVARIIGQIQTLKAFEDLSTAGKLKLFRDIKESKAYKGLVVDLQGQSVTLHTFEDFCQYMGCSYRKVAEDLSNLSFFGQAFMESAQAAGIGYRQLRQIRSLPEGDVEQIKAGSDPEILKELLEDKFIEVKKLREETEKVQKDSNAREALNKKLRKQLEETEIKLEKMTRLSPDEKAIKKSEAIQKLLEEAHMEGLKVIGQAAKFISKIIPIMEYKGASIEMLDAAAYLASAICRDIADKIEDADIQIDFRRIVYPDHLDDDFYNALRGEHESESSPELPAE